MSWWSLRTLCVKPEQFLEQGVARDAVEFKNSDNRASLFALPASLTVTA
jgi:hypothetical protein